jgi:anti-sigma regulatory factor (Ser/Thr protein kinase)
LCHGDAVEIVQGSVHKAFPLDDPSRVGEVRRHVAALCVELGFDEVLSAQAAIVVNELGTNLVKHAKGGRLLVATRGGAVPELEILSIDHGPGIGDLAMAMRDGFSTAGSPGTGLGAVKRLAADFGIHSDLAKGTVAVARLRRGAGPRSQFRYGVVALPAPGEVVCGDGWALAFQDERAALLLADGLGHGEHAAEASQAAVSLFVQQPFAQLKEAQESAHASLRMTRGAAVTRAVLDGDANTVRMVGAGNVLMRLVSGTSNRSVLPQNGTVGVQIRRVEEIRQEWPPHAVAVVHSDGLQSRWPPEAITPLLGADPSLAAAVLLRDYGRGPDDVTIVALRRDD